MRRLILHPNFFRLGFIIALVAIQHLATTTVSIKIIENTWDKLNHCVAFFVLYIFLSYSYSRMSVLIKVGLLVLFALQIEIVQHFIEGRFASFLDIVADIIGVILGIIVYKIERKYKIVY